MAHWPAVGTGWGFPILVEAFPASRTHSSLVASLCLLCFKDSQSGELCPLPQSRGPPRNQQGRGWGRLEASGAAPPPTLCAPCSPSSPSTRMPCPDEAAPTCHDLKALWIWEGSALPPVTQTEAEAQRGVGAAPGARGREWLMDATAFPRDLARRAAVGARGRSVGCITGEGRGAGWRDAGPGGVGVGAEDAHSSP